MTQSSLAALPLPVLILNLGAPETLPLGLNAAPAAAQIPAARYETLIGARHFSFLAPCSALGRIVIGLAGEDNICTDRDLRPRADIHADILNRTRSFLAAP